MANCTVVRTHRRGKPIPRDEWEPGLPGPVNMASVMHPELRREVRYLYLVRYQIDEPTYPNLFDPQWQTFGSGQGMIVSGFEEMGGHRYYQSWYVRWG